MGTKIKKAELCDIVKYVRKISSTIYSPDFCPEKGTIKDVMIFPSIFNAPNWTYLGRPI